MNPSEQRKIFANNLKYYIAINDKQQNEVASDLGIAQQTMNSWCMGVCIPRVDKLEKLADYFHIEKESLLFPKSAKADCDSQIKRITNMVSKLSVEQMDFVETMLKTMIEKGNQ